MEKVEKNIEIGGRKLTLSTGHVAQQATSAVLATYGETVVLATVVTAPLSREIDYFPLSVDYQERLYAGGRIKGSRWVKREGRPSDEEILISRLIDRSIRPLFPKNYKKEVQVIVTVLSVDLENSPSIVAGLAVSAALAISSLPWKGPVGFTKVGLKDGNFIVNPTLLENESSDMELYVASLSNAIVMIEAGSNQVPEDKMIEAIEFAQKQNTQIIDFINDFAKEIPVKKEPVEETSIPSSIEKKVKDLLKEKLSSLIKTMATKEASSSEYEDLKLAVADLFENPDEKALSVKCFENLFKSEIRNMILAGNRPDGRKTDELRRLSAEVSVLPRTHGSALFQRGQTQALSITTLGASSLEMLIESAEGEESKRYMHHYVFPPFSVGEVGKVGAPSKREIGHGALAERSLLPVIPSEDEFPYTIRVVTEILSSNGSTSMASVCGSTLSLMDAGVPIKAMVAGIAMGLVVQDEKNFTVLTDIVGLEDGNGDMDFKVAGTGLGITALQLDVKTLNLTTSILKKAFEQARKAREEILKVMEKAISSPRTNVSKYAPKIKMVRIDPEKIGEIIGSGGKTIKKISADTGVQIDIEDDGRVSVYGADEAAVDQAMRIIDGLTRDLNAGEIYEGEVKRLMNFGAFVEIFPGKEGLVHVSDISENYVNDPADVLEVGQKVQVRVKEIDDKGRLNLSMLLDPLMDKVKSEGGARGNRGGYDLSYGARNKIDNRRSKTSRRTRNRGDRSSGPHFPASRLLDNKDDF
ncbi:MAG: polyribonucleotide nucleotidyltransferase [Patescibacteria group bacterium]|nr:polyribonucleotide nucleotidyltransferase [Patescibacteria group bacterium]